MSIHRAYSVLDIKSVDDDQRIIEGVASTPEVDRQGDILESLGAEIRTPLPLLWQHRHDQPIGQVISAKTTKDGIRIRAKFAAAGVLGRIDEAWTLIKAGLVRGLSVGFNPLERAAIDGTYGVRFIKWELLEVSAVTVPANASASIQTIKSLDAEHLAAHGDPSASRQHIPGASGHSRGSPAKGRSAMKPLSQQIEELNTKRTDIVAKMEAIAAKGDITALQGEDGDAYDDLTSEMEQVDKSLRRLEALEQTTKDRLKPVTRSNGDGVAFHTSVVVPPSKREYAKGTLFTRYAMAKAAGRGSLSDTLAYAKQRWADTPEVEQYIKAEAGTAVPASPGWGSELVYQQNLVSEFVELLRAATVLGKINGLRTVPFNSRVVVQTGGSTVNWTGEKAPKPVSELSFTTLQIPNHKVTGIVVLTEELVRLSSPSAEEAVRRDLTEQIARFIDVQLLAPGVGVGANNPASLTNGVSAVGASGPTAEALYVDMNEALSAFDDADMGTESVVVVTTPALARGISTLRNSLGQFEFSGMNPTGGTLNGFPVIVSNSAPSGYLVFVKANEVFVADDGRVTVDASNQATLDMSGGSSPDFNLWQNNCIGIRAERWITWLKRRDDAVAAISGATYGPASDE